VTCRELDTTIARCATGAIDPASTRELVEHAAGCSSCREAILLLTPPPRRDAFLFALERNRP